MNTALAVAAFILEWALTVIQVLAIWLLIGAIFAIGLTTLLWRGRTPLWLDEEPIENEPPDVPVDVIEVLRYPSEVPRGPRAPLDATTWAATGTSDGRREIRH